MSVYTLVLEQNKYYVGFTNRTVEERFQEHLEDYGSKWTSIYKPLQILCVRPGDLQTENEVTLEMMRKYGWWNVRGGSWCKVDMFSPPLSLYDSDSNNDTESEYESDIYGFPDSDTDSISSVNSDNFYMPSADDNPSYSPPKTKYIYKDDNPSYSPPKTKYSACNKKKYCYRCGRESHFVKDCYASIHKKGHYL